MIGDEAAENARPSHASGAVVPLRPDAVPWPEGLRSALVGFCLKRTRDQGVAEDITQETLARLLALARTQEVRNAPALAYRIAENLIRDHYRAERRAASEPVGDDLLNGEASLEDAAIQRERMAYFQRLLAAMPPLRRAVFIRRRLHGQSHDEIARALSLSPAAVEKHVVRAIAWLSAEMDRLDNNGERP